MAFPTKTHRIKRNRRFRKNVSPRACIGFALMTKAPFIAIPLIVGPDEEMLKFELILLCIKYSFYIDGLVINITTENAVRFINCVQLLTPWFFFGHIDFVSGPVRM
ncbi:hypothetical protein D3C76_939850 [compost metagenome]